MSGRLRIPLKLSHTVVDITGVDRVESVTVAPVDENKRPIMEKAEVIKCDTLLLSVGLIPENELSKTAGVELSPVTKGAVVNQFKQTEVPSVFACGNVATCQRPGGPCEPGKRRSRTLCGPLRGRQTA